MKTESNKVFCKDCKYFHHNSFDVTIISCTKTSLARTKLDPCYGLITEIDELPSIHPRDRNQHFNCQYFTKKRWWQI